MLGRTMGLTPADGAIAGVRGCSAGGAVTGAALGQGTPEKALKEENLCLRIAYVSARGLGQRAPPGGWMCWGCRELVRLGWDRGDIRQLQSRERKIWTLVRS